MTRILTVVGARPQFVKAATVSRALRQQPSAEEMLVHTGQHYDDNMSATFFDLLDIPKPRWNLGIGSGGHGAQTGRMLEALAEIMAEARPDWALVYGDTNSTLAGALAAAKLHIPVAHVEAGLRSFNRRMPEEVNRVMADHLSSMLFVPTANGVDNLAREGISGSSVRLVGDVMFDAVRFYGQRVSDSGVLAGFGVTARNYILATIHRAENTDDPDRLSAIVEGLVAASSLMPVILPAHPRTRAALLANNIDVPAGSGLNLVDPVDYLTMLALERDAALMVTDSGGMQKEAFFCGVQCVTVRDETEWTELIEAGWNELCPPTSAGALLTAITGRLGRTPPERPDLYGQGDASEKVARMLVA